MLFTILKTASIDFISLILGDCNINKTSVVGVAL